MTRTHAEYVIALARRDAVEARHAQALRAAIYEPADAAYATYQAAMPYPDAAAQASAYAAYEVVRDECHEIAKATDYRLPADGASA